MMTMVRPKCQMNVSKTCTKDNPRDAIMMVHKKDGGMTPCCHRCNWVNTRGVEWDPKRV